MKRLYKGMTAVALACTIMATSCKKEYLETNPTDLVSADIVFKTTEGAMVALNGTIRTMYSSLTNHGNFGQKAYDLTSDMMGEDVILHAQGYRYYTSEYNYSGLSSASTNQRADRTWYYYYRIINNANRIISLLPAATGTQEEKDLIMGQALALRAHSYYYLVNFFSKYGPDNPGVPLYTVPTTEGKGRGTVKDVYDQIYLDLTESIKLLEGKSRAHLSHVNKATAEGIFARVALQRGDFPKALEMADKAIKSSGKQLFTAAQYTSAAFNTLSAAEWIWGGEVNVEQSTAFASFYSHMDNRAAVGGYAALGGQKKITKDLYDKIQAGDVRKDLFQGVISADMPIYAQKKFQLRQLGNWASDYLFMRLSELYLIKAEAQARLTEDVAAAQTLTDLVITRYSGYTAAGLAGEALLNEILLQRKIELWGEGFSLLDIKRLGKGLNRPTGAGNHGGAQLNGGNGNNFAPGVTTLPANSNRWLFAIPQDEINANKQLSVADQNPLKD
ncbi:RagB/SusD family nutrient uptake outer membrane protein [Sphingobacterium faecale]|uniref:RagB/SusD family nutrient uptake outer membrane protein n=1 Tax=Sphingobacterium faecale TaxID=2803775 RepID=A0ABS1R7N2_9SPHI|nr:RagB/SusD family nutrient uptake outer membrane protein [Sphingobacterium faecale]MBL1410717.1 RagB/SusD family nutrient uptake outer membrane protein [Sphingobacterium faecale]MBL1410719.1 RagB/SusD family nutrient uptake outer membrane protein [Sphingobacterium faecale]